MPADLLKFSDGRLRIDLDRCYFPFVERAILVLAACRARGQDYFPTFGFRSFRQQEQLYQAWREAKGGKAAPPGLSAHNYGLAWDLCADGDRDRGGLQPSWDLKRYKILGEETERLGLVWGGRFGDSPHIQWPGFVNGEQLRQLKNLWVKYPDHASDAQKLLSIWSYLDVLEGAKP